MNEFWARLNSTERRFVVGVAVVFFLVINIVWVWPHFADWGNTKGRMAAARTRLVTYETGTNLMPDLKKKIDKYQGQGQIVPAEDQGLQFARVVQNQTTLYGIVPQNMTIRKEASTGGTTNNSFFVDQVATMRLDTTEKQLVDFLYSIGVGSNSLIRVKALSVQPDPSHQRLSVGVTLAASYQRKAIASAAPAAAAGQAPKTTAAPNSAKPPTGAPTNSAKPGAIPLPNKAGVTNRSAIRPTTNQFPAAPAGPKQTPKK
jgi:hypothetical protein